jgi:gas vesicle protein
MSKSSSWLFGAVLGGLLGSSLARLYTPYSGEELKAKVCDYIQNVRYEVEQAGIEKRAELETQLDELRSGNA